MKPEIRPHQVKISNLEYWRELDPGLYWLSCTHVGLVGYGRRRVNKQRKEASLKLILETLFLATIGVTRGNYLATLRKVEA